MRRRVASNFYIYSSSYRNVLLLCIRCTVLANLRKGKEKKNPHLLVHREFFSGVIFTLVIIDVHVSVMQI